MLQHGKHVAALLAQRIEAAADDAEILGAIECADCMFGRVVGERDRAVADEAQDGVAVLAEAAQYLNRAIVRPYQALEPDDIDVLAEYLGHHRQNMVVMG